MGRFALSTLSYIFFLVQSKKVSKEYQFVFPPPIPRDSKLKIQNSNSLLFSVLFFLRLFCCALTWQKVLHKTKYHTSVILNMRRLSFMAATLKPNRLFFLFKPFPRFLSFWSLIYGHFCTNKKLFLPTHFCSHIIPFLPLFPVQGGMGLHHHSELEVYTSGLSFFPHTDLLYLPFSRHRTGVRPPVFLFFFFFVFYNARYNHKLFYSFMFSECGFALWISLCFHVDV